MTLIFWPSLFFSTLIAIMAYLSRHISRGGRRNAAWAVFLIIAFPSLVSLIVINTVDWGANAAGQGLTIYLADIFGGFLAVSIISMLGLFLRSARAGGMLVMMVILGNSNYIFGIDILKFDAQSTMPVFFASALMIVAYAVVDYWSLDSPAPSGSKSSRNFEAMPQDGGPEKALEKSLARQVFSNLVVAKSSQMPAIISITIFSILGACSASLLVLTSAMAGNNADAYFILINRPNFLILPGLLGAAIGAGVGWLRRDN